MTKKRKLITATMTIADVIKDYPQTAEVMLSYGLHCVGCVVNKFETIAQGASAHGMTSDLLEQMIGEMNVVIGNKPEYDLTSAGLTLSPSALKILKIMNKTDHGGKASLKIKVDKVDGELDYFLDLVVDPEVDDQIIEEQGFKIFIDDQSLKLIKPSLIDYLKTKDGEGFKVVSLK